MKLYDWLQVDYPGNTTMATKGLHVIGTCGDCKWIDNGSMDKRFCENALGMASIVRVSDGCIHWEPKEGDVTGPDKSTTVLVPLDAKLPYKMPLTMTESLTDEEFEALNGQKVMSTHAELFVIKDRLIATVESLKGERDDYMENFKAITYDCQERSKENAKLKAEKETSFYTHADLLKEWDAALKRIEGMEGP